MVFPSFHRPFCLAFRLSGRFLGIVLLVFSKFWCGARNPYKVVHGRAGFFRKNFFVPKTGKMDQKWHKKQGFLNLFRNFVINFYWICSIMKTFAVFLYKPQIWEKLKLTVSQEWIDGMNWYFACWCKFTLKSYFNDFWMGVVRNGCGHLVHEPRNSAVTKEFMIGFVSLYADCEAIILRSTLYSISLTFKCQSTAVVFFGPLAVARRVLWNRVCPSFHPAVCWGVFLELGH